MLEPRDKAIIAIRSEHRSISALLHGLCHLAREAAEAKMKPDFAVFRAMLYYLDEYPERLHHPKEERALFSRLAGCCEAFRLVRRLHEEHEAGARLVSELEHRLLEFEMRWPRGAVQFRDLALRYAELQWKHMRSEERELLPLAERLLAHEDWDAVAEAFSRNVDPLAEETERDFDRLFSRIVALAPEPVGLGERWESRPQPAAPALSA
jgi:hemerythrin-like domain-containing protein